MQPPSPATATRGATLSASVSAPASHFDLDPGATAAADLEAASDPASNSAFASGAGSAADADRDSAAPPAEADPITAPPTRTGWLWCSTCGFAFPRGEYRLEHGRQLCPYPGYTADTATHAWPWEEVLKDYPEYPPIPKRGVRYGK